MTLDDALALYADFLGLDAEALSAYAQEDRLGGYHTDPEQCQFPCGSLWQPEGQTLYALIRALRPKHILELGTLHGASTAHLRAAVRDNHQWGRVHSVDIWKGAGSLIPPALDGYGHLVFMDAVVYIEQWKQPNINFVFEDALHGYEQVRDIVNALKPKLAPGAVVVHHDSEHGDDGVKIKQGLADAGITEYVSTLIEPSDCGLLIYRIG